jgi:rhodanese-related sulfurtransferase
LGELQDKDSAGAIAASMNGVKDMDTNPQRATTAIALGRMEDPRALETMIDLLHEPPWWSTMPDIVSALRHLDDPRVTPALLHALCVASEVMVQYGSVKDCDDLVAAVPSRILDVRQRTEWEDGHLPGSRHRFVGDLPEHLPELARAGETLVTCASGYRASMAASLLDAAGGTVRVVTDGGVPDALRRKP